MQKKLLLAINEGSEGFGFAWFKNEEKKTATESDYVPSLKRGFSSRLETLESQEVLPENWFLKDGSLRDHGLDSEVEDLDIGRLSKDVFFFTMEVHRKWEGLTFGWRRQKGFSSSSPLLNAYPILASYVVDAWLQEHAQRARFLPF